MDSLAVIIPTYGNFEYLERCLYSLDHTTSNYTAIVVDDASPDWDDRRDVRLDHGNAIFHRFSENGGITRSWNYGLQRARELGLKYSVATNSDVLFTPGWFEELKQATDHLDLVGPLTNAPGDSNLQRIQTHTLDYQLTDDWNYLEELARRLIKDFGGQVMKCRTNGFCQFALTSTYWKHAFSKTHVYSPALRMTGSEHDLGNRIRKSGGSTGVALSSFVFHYRGVSRGLTKDYVCRGSYRRTSYAPGSVSSSNI